MNMACYKDHSCSMCGTVAYNVEPGDVKTCYICGKTERIPGTRTAYCASLGSGFHGDEYNLGWERRDLSANVGRRSGGLQPSSGDSSSTEWWDVAYIVAKGVSDAVKTADRRHRYNQLWHTNAFQRRR